MPRPFKPMKLIPKQKSSPNLSSVVRSNPRTPLSGGNNNTNSLPGTSKLNAGRTDSQSNNTTLKSVNLNLNRVNTKPQKPPGNDPKKNTITGAPTGRLPQLNTVTEFARSDASTNYVGSNNGNMTQELVEDKIGQEGTKRRPTGPNGTPPQTFIEYCAANNVNYLTVRKICRQPVRDNDPSKLVWDAFRLPDEFAGEELPPLPPSPEPVGESPFFALEEQERKRQIRRLQNDNKRKEMLCMDEMIEHERKRAETRKLEYERKGIPPPTDQEMDNTSDLNGSFIMEYSPSPVVLSERSNKKRIKIGRGDNTNCTTPKRSKTTAVTEMRMENGSVDCTPKSPVRESSSKESSVVAVEELQSLRRTRLLFDEPMSAQSSEEQDEIWSDDDILSQIDLDAVESASAEASGSRCSSAPLLTQGQSDNVVSGDGESFDDMDPEDDYIFTQISY